MNTYIKKPIEVMAIQYKGLFNLKEVLDFIEPYETDKWYCVKKWNMDRTELYEFIIQTPDRQFLVREGDYIICDKIQFWNCEKEYFEKYYDLI